MKVTREEQASMVEWIKANRQNCATDKECFESAQRLMRDGKEPILSTSNTVGSYMRKAGFAAKPKANGESQHSPLDAIRAAESQIKEALRELDAERNRLSNRIKEIDNIEAKYRKVLFGGDALRTQDEIVARIKSLQNSDIFGFETSELVMFLDYDHAKEFLKPEVKREEWTPSPNEAQATLKTMREYMDFAWEKANNGRGISAGRSMHHYSAWVWMLGDEGKLPNLNNYKFYGKDHLVSICKLYGWNHKQWDNGER